MKHLHIFPDEKFTSSYIQFVNKHFTEKEHLFLIFYKTGQTKYSYKNVIELSNDIKGLLTLIKEMYRCDKIYLHSLFIMKVVMLLFFQPWLLKKSKWIVWGGDLYCYRDIRRTIKEKLKEGMRQIVIKNVGGLITHIKGDYDLAKVWYKAKGKHYYSFMYPSNLYEEFDFTSVQIKTDKKYIQVGNSADPSNNHIEIFGKLLTLRKNADYEIICPLSYGKSSYAESVIQKGYELFGNKFIPLTEFMPFGKYLEILAKIDIAIFNHKRQQAVGNITTLLSLGKKVYIRDDITTWEFCKDHNLIVYSVNNEFEGLFEPLPIEVKNMNKASMKKQFSEENLVSDWESIFRKS
jgi:dTDP-N-acetylfucosamine:lipid II N-acetylfucosaminyltransferase